jgi:hypothetical protein
MPHGSGFDNGTSLDVDASSDTKIVFTTAFHHMNEGGFYDGWTQHSIIVTPNLAIEFNLKVTGRNRNGIKDYIAECFQFQLCEDVTRLEKFKPCVTVN